MENIVSPRPFGDSPPATAPTLDQMLERVFGEDWQLQRPQSAGLGFGGCHSRSYVHYLMGRGEKGAMYHSLWFPGSSLSFSLDQPMSPIPPERMTKRVGSAVSARSQELREKRDNQRPKWNTRPKSAQDVTTRKAKILDLQMESSSKIFNDRIPPRTPRASSARQRKPKKKETFAYESASSRGVVSEDDMMLVINWGSSTARENAPPVQPRETGSGDAASAAALMEDLNIGSEVGENDSDDNTEEVNDMSSINENGEDDNGARDGADEDEEEDADDAEKENDDEEHSSSHDDEGAVHQLDKEEPISEMTSLNVTIEVVHEDSEDDEEASEDAQQPTADDSPDVDQTHLLLPPPPTLPNPALTVERYEVFPQENMAEEPTVLETLHEDEESYILSDDPHEFVQLYTPLLPPHLDVIDLESQASIDRDWKLDLDYPPLPQEEHLMNRLYEIAKHQIVTAKEEDYLRRPRYQRPKSSYSNRAAATSAPAVTVSGTSSSNTSRPKSAAVSSRKCCKECLQPSCSGDCPQKKPVPPCKRCQQCRQLFCEGGTKCPQKRPKYSQTAREAKPEIPKKERPKSSRLSDNDKTKNALRLKSRILGRPKSADATFAAAKAVSRPVTAPKVFSINRVDLSTDLADYLEYEEPFQHQHRPVNPPYLSRPPPPPSSAAASRPMSVAVASRPISVEQRLSALCTPGLDSAVQEMIKSSRAASPRLIKRPLTTPAAAAVTLSGGATPSLPYRTIYKSHNMKAHSSGKLRGSLRTGRLTTFSAANK